MISCRSNGCSSATNSNGSRFDDDLTYLDNSLDVAVSFGEVDGPQLGGSFSVLIVALKDTTSPLTLTPDNSTHFERLSLIRALCKDASMGTGQRSNYAIVFPLII